MADVQKNRIKELREDRQLTQKELATLVGLDYTTVSRHENTHRGLSREDIEKYAAVFKCPTHELFFDPAKLAD